MMPGLGGPRILYPLHAESPTAGKCGGAPRLNLKPERGGGPATHPGPGTLYVGGGVLRGPFSGRAPHTHKLHMQVLWMFHGGWQQWFVTIIFSLGQLLSATVVCAAFSCQGTKG